MIKVVGSKGLQSASVRTIAREAGCNEAVLYQHFSGKAAMQEAIFWEIQNEMADEKQEVAQRVTNVGELIREWVAATYRFYDRKPFAFAYVYLSYPPISKEDPSVPGPNTRLFTDAMGRLPAPDGHQVAFDESTFTVFTAGILAVPRAIHAGLLGGKAMDYYDRSIEPLTRIFLTDA